MKVESREAGTSEEARLKTKMPAVKSAYQPSGKLPVGALFALAGGAVLAVLLAAALGLLLVVFSGYLLIAVPQVAGEINALPLLLKVPIGILALPVFVGIIAFCVVGPSAISGGIAGMVTASLGCRGKNRNIAAAVGFSAISSLLALGLLRVGPLWQYAEAWGDQRYVAVAGHWIGTAIGGLIMLGAAAFTASETVRSSKFCERCQRNMIPRSSDPVSLSALPGLVMALKAGNWTKGADYLNQPIDEVGAELRILECPTCGDGFCDLEAKVLIEWKDGRTNIKWLAASKEASGTSIAELTSGHRESSPVAPSLSSNSNA